ncbi:MAG: transketolase [Rickettsiales bacterium]|jgi:transketolase|nr:transketolase [Rickettsiales bacterium]
MDNKNLRLMANAARFLSIEMIAKANSGHPGLPLGFADVAAVLFSEFLKFVPQKPTWADRDRFVMSAGHGSALLYSLLYLTGYEDCDLEQIKNFRQLHSKTAGHPEYGCLKGVESSTGPLGQGVANAVGMAIAERHLNARFGDDIVNHKTYCMVGDGCLMEGISYEALGLAGSLNLKNLIILWDDNEITIDGNTSITRAENMKMRMESVNFKYLSADGHDFDSIRNALGQAQNSDRPTFIDFRTKIGFGSPKEGTNKCHGSPLKGDELAETKKSLGCGDWTDFEIPAEIKNLWSASGKRQGKKFFEWLENAEKSEKFGEFSAMLRGELGDDWKKNLEEFKKQIIAEAPKEATRKSSQRVLDILARDIKQLIGGAADLTGSALTKAASMEILDKNSYGGNYINYGVREHAMAAIMNGLTLHRGVIPYGGTFFCFVDYEKPALRLASMMGLRTLHILTHDSIGLGEDGPTHQPIEHLASLRALPNFNVFRPADLQETIDCYETALESKYAPSALVLSRQNVDFIGEKPDGNLAKMGAYVLRENKKAQITLIGTGAEVNLALQTQRELKNRGLEARVVSAPCLNIFDRQPKEYRNEVLGRNTLKAAIEAACAYGWHRYIGENGLFFGIGDDKFGISAPAEEIYKYFGLTAENISNRIAEKIAK